MTNIHFPVDGQGTQSLKKQNTNDKNSFHVDATLPESKNQKNNQDKDKEKLKKQPSKDNTAGTPENKQSIQETRTEIIRTPNRRQENRRKERAPVVLDTRSEQDRRKNTGQREDDINNHDEQFGIDTKA